MECEVNELDTDRMLREHLGAVPRPQLRSGFDASWRRRRPPATVLVPYLVAGCVFTAVALRWTSPPDPVIQAAMAVLAAVLLPVLLKVALARGERAGSGMARRPRPRTAT